MSGYFQISVILVFLTHLTSLTLGQSCDIEHKCPDELDCVNKLCSCPFPTHQSRDSSSRLCVTKVGGPCLEEVNGVITPYPCVPHAECRNVSGLHECACEEGYSTPDYARSRGHCFGTYGRPCTSSDDCISDFQCRNGKCDCLRLHDYDEEARTCNRGLVGATCSTRSSGWCVDGAYCEGPLFSSDGGVCRCREGFQSTSWRRCEPVNEPSVD